MLPCASSDDACAYSMRSAPAAVVSNGTMDWGAIAVQSTSRASAWTWCFESTLVARLSCWADGGETPFG